MYALEQPLVRRQTGLLDQTPWGALAALACGIAGVTILSVAGLVPRAAVGIAGFAASAVLIGMMIVSNRRNRGD